MSNNNLFVSRIDSALAEPNKTRRYRLLLDLVDEYTEEHTTNGFLINSDNEHLKADLERGGLVFNNDTGVFYIRDTSGNLYRRKFLAFDSILPSITTFGTASGKYGAGTNSCSITGVNLTAASSIELITDNAKVTGVVNTILSNEIITIGSIDLTLADATPLETIVNVKLVVDGIESESFPVLLTGAKTVTATVSGASFGNLAIGVHTLSPTSYTEQVTGTAPVDETWKYQYPTQVEGLTTAISFTDLGGKVVQNNLTAIPTASASSVTGLSNDGYINDGVFTSYTVRGATITLSKGYGWS